MGSLLGGYLLIDWGTEGGLTIFCAVLAWSRYRFVRFATDERRGTTLGSWPSASMTGRGPAVVLADRMARDGCADRASRRGSCQRGPTIWFVRVPESSPARWAVT
ncbi:MAG: hypothetical protein ACRDH0_13080 [Actinomycetota bacterium]